ncbi:MAG: Isochorismatase family protein [Cyanobacteriota bacterium erpe_2018_sw_39hr_WHONDRS-SW48-000098_B_bin.30]|jgi:nicotinamidase-related amidase|nr:hypothetical protein [Candidatus Obscuribacter sp.]MBK7839956.1 hypothetical protein [Candidatus Obscuribacter sp.]MBK9621413.1 hypothetical protein [Candidatus Obscuribacter sp.]MDQ5967456.1 Isochorismatase family protein [Cyanobacteriota bacterium erpe_2018_sw_39hr_WHONDRS-SW48-000098_B_bin.30]
MNTATNFDSNTLLPFGLLNVSLTEAIGKVLRTFCAEEAVLIVNDMQPGFEAARDIITIFAVSKQIEMAMALNLTIILVEYDAHELGATLPQITRMLEGYEHLSVVSKSQDNGAAAILKVLCSKAIETQDFILCGVNSDACILDTVKGLVQWLPHCRILLPQDACNSINGKDCSVWHNEFKRIANVVLQMHGG